MWNSSANLRCALITLSVSLELSRLLPNVIYNNCVLAKVSDAELRREKMTGWTYKEVRITEKRNVYIPLTAVMMQRTENPLEGKRSLDYIPVYVTPLLSIKNPPTPGSQTAMYATAISPQAPLRVGDQVHLHLLCLPRQEQSENPEERRRPAAVPLEIWGKISGERERDELEVEFVIRNDNEDAQVRRVFLRARADSRGATTPTRPDNERVLRRPQLREVRGVGAGRRRHAEEDGEPAGPRAPTNTQSEADGSCMTHSMTPGPRAYRESARDGTGGGRTGTQPPGECSGGRREPKTPLREQSWRGPLEVELWPGRRAEAPGPSERVFPQWMAPKERRRRRRRADVGASPGRTQEALGREQSDLCQS